MVFVAKEHRDVTNPPPSSSEWQRYTYEAHGTGFTEGFTEGSIEGSIEGFTGGSIEGSIEGSAKTAAAAVWLATGNFKVVLPSSRIEA